VTARVCETGVFSGDGWTKTRRECGQPAVWMARVVCKGGHEKWEPFCDPHLGRLRARTLTCTTCQQPVTLGDPQ
jgi:hypothetical protein